MNCKSRAVGRSENLGVPMLFDGRNLTPSVEIGLTDLPKSGGAMAPPAPPGTTGLKREDFCGIRDYVQSRPRIKTMSIIEKIF